MVLLRCYATVSTSNHSINSTSKCCAFLLKDLKKGDLSHLASTLVSILEALIESHWKVTFYSFVAGYNCEASHNHVNHVVFTGNCIHGLLQTLFSIGKY